jgi:hypothetical protein
MMKTTTTKEGQLELGESMEMARKVVAVVMAAG